MDLKERGSDALDRISGIYEALNDLRPQIDDDGKVKLKEAFQENELIYTPVDGEQAWHRISQCIWSSGARLRGKVPLNDKYKSLEELFVKFLGVSRVTLAMAIDELKEAGDKTTTPTEQLKESIWTVNSLLPRADQIPNAKSLSKSSIFPIRRPDGQISHVSEAVQFHLVDRSEYAENFKGKVKFLDFSLEEITRLSPFLKWTQITSRYLSTSVKAVTSISSGGTKLSSNSERQIGNRAHAILRIANHFGSPRTGSKSQIESLYKVLKGAEIIESDGISSDLSLAQDGTAYKVAVNQISLHIDDSDGLKIYVPRNKDDQEYAFSNLLGPELFAWIMTGPGAKPKKIDMDGVAALARVLLAPRSRITIALERNGIGMVDVPNSDAAVTFVARDETEMVEDSESQMTDTPTSSSRASPSLVSNDAEVLSKLGRQGLVGSQSLSLRPASSISTGVVATQPDLGDPQYVRLLSKVISAARKHTLPVYGVEPKIGTPTFHEYYSLGLSASSKTEELYKIGAAGELYVFELLSHLKDPLPNFSWENWASQIRTLVKVHPEYATLTKWELPETSDLLYHDVKSVLTQHLVEKGYLADDWTGRTPNYHIEVKTTTMACVTAFYMSDAQYTRMGKNTLRGGNKETVYAIFRVYNLGQENMGLKIYVDPEESRRCSELDFAPETWSVVPGAMKQG